MDFATELRVGIRSVATQVRLRSYTMDRAIRILLPISAKSLYIRSLICACVFTSRVYIVVTVTRYATAASTKYRHRSYRSATLSTAIMDDDDTILSTLPPTPQRLGGTGRQVAPNEYRPPAIVWLSCVNRRTTYNQNFDFPNV
ncbi:Uncharacterized protein FWK35_00001921 [Aphis craccivora]|uniref:Uncharacterized protein n=1 Tax=Aphis craccivora TaxID=307492 RepID=A0A6G0ZH31_APHCR|nr:Uncharacterized protein FWK35_00001921 [Aphis craccivora]